MEGRVQPTKVTSPQVEREDISLNLWLDSTRASPSEERKETYVVRMPRDQVYRVPPPEHAKLIEGYRNIPKEKKGHRITCCCWVLIAILLLGCAIGIFIGVSHLLFRPKSPVFHVASFSAKNLETNKQRTPPSFDILVKVSNPNSKISASYMNGDDSSLIFNKVKIGDGDFKVVSQGVVFNLDGTKATSSKEINAKLNDNTGKKINDLGV